MDHSSGATAPEIPGPGEAVPPLLPDTVALPARTELGIEVLLGGTAAEITA